MRKRKGPRRRTCAERFWEKVDIRGADECWVWTAALDLNGYGVFHQGGHQASQWKAHRFAYESGHGPVPDGLVLDHLCENTSCVNPAHLEAVSQQDHMLRHHGQRTLCLHGHPLDGLRRDRTTDGLIRVKRYCKTCRREAERQRRLARPV